MGGATTAAAGSARFAEAQGALAADPSRQWLLTRPPKPPETPAWLRVIGEWLARALRPVGRAIAWLFGQLPALPYARILLWTVIAVVVGLIVVAAVGRVRDGVWRWPRWPRRRRGVTEPIPDAAPAIAAAPMRAWLAEADALAAAGRFAEAAHLLLFRSVEDLARRRPGVVRPALTARELAATAAFPPAVRDRFAAIAALVERSLFGGRGVAGGEWQAARASYAELAQPALWRRM